MKITITRIFFVFAILAGLLLVNLLPAQAEEEEINPSVTLTPTPTIPLCPDGQINNPNIRICLSCPGDGECEVIIGSTPTEIPSPTVLPTVTPTPEIVVQSTSGSKDNGSSNEEKRGEVTAAPELPKTGSEETKIATMLEIIGLLLLAAGTVLYGKKNKKIFFRK